MSGMVGRTPSVDAANIDGLTYSRSLGLQSAASAQIPEADDVQLQVVSADYSAAEKLLALAFADGRSCLCKGTESGLHPIDKLEFSYWLSKAGSGAVRVAIGTKAQLVAVGFVTGEVALYPLYGSRRGPEGIPEPVRMLSLKDWEYRPEFTGSVAVLHWSADASVLAVSFENPGITNCSGVYASKCQASSRLQSGKPAVCFPICLLANSFC